MANSTARGSSGARTKSGGQPGAVGTEGYPDLQTELEEEMDASGRDRVVPRSGLVGAHQQRHGSLAASVELDEPGEPAGPGAEVAPTRRAEQREQRRHELERGLGVETAGDGNLRQRRAQGTDRSALDGAGREADRLISEQVAAGDDPNEQRGGDEEAAGGAAWMAAAGSWLRAHPLPVALGATVLVGTACLLASRRD